MIIKIVKSEKRKTARNTTESITQAIIRTNGIDVIIVPEISIMLIVSLLIDWIMRSKIQQQSRIFNTWNKSMYSLLIRVGLSLGSLCLLHSLLKFGDHLLQNQTVEWYIDMSA